MKVLGAIENGRSFEDQCSNAQIVSDFNEILSDNTQKVTKFINTTHIFRQSKST